MVHNHEFARQVLNIARGLAAGTGITIETTFGLDLIVLRKLDILISTPKCVLENLKRKETVAELQTVVFDEADLLLGSFSRTIADIMQILKQGGLSSKFTHLHKNQKPSTKHFGAKFMGQFVIVGVH